jgi:branched-chain amino acid transport system permease protein
MSRAGCAAAAAMAAVAIALPFSLKPFGILLISMWAVLTIAAIGLNLTLGYAGQVSLAQGAFVGIGAYTVAILIGAGCPYALAFIAAGALCFAAGWLLGYPALRVQHHYLAFVTLAFTTLVFLVMRNEEWLTGGAYGIDNIRRPAFFGWSTEPPLDFYFLCLGALAVLAAAAWWMVRSPWGRAFIALRENPVRAASLGVDTRRYTLMAFAIGSSLGGLAGALYAPLVQFVEPPKFGLSLSFDLLLMVIVGGSGHFFGPFIGAFIAVMLPQGVEHLVHAMGDAGLLPEWMMRIAEKSYLILYAGLIMAMMAFRPAGIMGLIESAWNMAWRKPAGSAGVPPALSSERDERTGGTPALPEATP